MGVLTEAALRVELKDADLDAMTEFRVEKGVIVTPSARAWLTDHKIDLIIGEKRVIKNPSAPAPQPEKQTLPEQTQEQKSALPDFEKPARYNSLYGGFFDRKPEHMTALYGNMLVNKDHPRIALRGKLDSLTAEILKVMLAFQRLNMPKGIAELEEVYAYTQEILRCEVLNEPLKPVSLFGMDEDEIRKHSHTPKKYYGMPHFAASLADGEAVILLNGLRTMVREGELTAYAAFRGTDGLPERDDIIAAFNRLSSVFYVMMFRAKTGVYDDNQPTQG